MCAFSVIHTWKNTYIHRETHKNVHSGLFVRADNFTTQSSTKGEYQTKQNKNHLWYVHKIKYCSAIKLEQTTEMCKIAYNLKKICIVKENFKIC